MRKHLIKPMLICLLGFTISFSLLIHSAYAYDLFFADTQQTQGELTGYVLGTGENQIIIYTTNTNLFIIQQDFAGTGKDLIRYRTYKIDHVEKAHNLTEFIGMSYVDSLMRFATGQSNYSLDNLKLLFRCQWQKADLSYISGTIAQYEADTTKTGVVFFTGSVQILGE